MQHHSDLPLMPPSICSINLPPMTEPRLIMEHGVDSMPAVEGWNWIPLGNIHRPSPALMAVGVPEAMVDEAPMSMDKPFGPHRNSPLAPRNEEEEYVEVTNSCSLRFPLGLAFLALFFRKRIATTTWCPPHCWMNSLRCVLL
jgi:hypothetical protein